MTQKEPWLRFKHCGCEAYNLNLPKLNYEDENHVIDYNFSSSMCYSLFA